MSDIVKPRIKALSGYVPGEQPKDADRIIKLNTNECPYPPSPRVGEALAACAADLARYPAPLADPLRDAAAARYGVNRGQVMVGNGSDELLTICVRACACDGGRIAYFEPTYSLYSTLASIEGASVVTAPWRPGDALPDALLDSGADILFLCNPSSPFGAPLPLGEVARAAERFAGLVVSDEAYVDFGGTTALPLLGEYPNLLVLRTFSKSFSLAGLRLGLAFGNEPLMAELAKVKDSYNASRPAIAGGLAALEDYDWMLENTARICATRDRTIAALRAGGYTVGDSAANFFFLECGEHGGKAAYDRLRAGGVLVRFFDTDDLRSGIRVTVGTDEEMDRFLEVFLGT